jgi:hypothetical protein
MARRLGLMSPRKTMAKWLTLYHPTRRIITTILDTDEEKLDTYKRTGWKIGALPPEALPDSFVELEAMVEAGDLIGASLPKKAEPKKSKKAKKE